MRGHHKNLNVYACEAIENVVGEARHSVAPYAGGKLDSISLWVLTDLGHCHIKRSEVARTEPPSLGLVVRDVFKMFYPRRFAEEVAHLSKACA